MDLTHTRTAILSLALGALVFLGASFSYAAWHGTDWIAQGAVIDPVRIKNNFDYLYGMWVKNGATLSYIEGSVGVGTAKPSAQLTVGASPGSAGNVYYNIGADKIAAHTSVYSYGRLCAGNTAGNCLGTGGTVVRADGIQFPDGTVQTTASDDHGWTFVGEFSGGGATSVPMTGLGACTNLMLLGSYQLASSYHTLLLEASTDGGSSWLDTGFGPVSTTALFAYGGYGGDASGVIHVYNFNSSSIKTFVSAYGGPHNGPFYYNFDQTIRAKNALRLRNGNGGAIYGQWQLFCE